jgi:hypothetical protein
MRATTLTLILTVVWLRVYEWVARAWFDVLCFECSKQVREMSTAEGGVVGGTRCDGNDLAFSLACLVAVRPAVAHATLTTL